MIFIPNKYTKWYFAIIDNATTRITTCYTEQHHIIPDCFFKNRTRKGPAGWLNGNPEDSSNKVKLTAKEHFVCHHLLTKMIADSRPKAQMLKALERMTASNNNHQRHKITARLFQQIRIEAADAQSTLTKGKPAWNKGKTYTNKTYKRLTCPHCGLEGIVTNIKRWHNDNCKLIPMRPKIFSE